MLPILKISTCKNNWCLHVTVVSQVGDNLFSAICILRIRCSCEFSTVAPSIGRICYFSFDAAAVQEDYLLGSLLRLCLFPAYTHHINGCSVRRRIWRQWSL